MRTDERPHRTFTLKPSDLGGRVGEGPLPVKLICLTAYVQGASWEPVEVTRGEAALAIVPFTFSFIDRPGFALPILNKIVERATIISGKRGAAELFAKTFLEFVDKLSD
jgi:hypothetical protein